jgi:hypothetical protein
MKFTSSILRTVGSAGLILAVAMSIGFSYKAANVALITKVIQDVTKKTSEAEWQKAGKGETLLSGDKVRTGQKSLAVVKFLDNSIVRVRENSELTMNTEVAGIGTLRNVQLNKGGYGFHVKKQQNDQFRLTSPTSVASIRGTMGKFSGGAGADTLVVTEGLVNLRNVISGKELDVAAGEIGFSSEDGTVTSRKATEQELADANSTATGGTDNELKLELRDGQGNKKELKLKYKK